MTQAPGIITKRAYGLQPSQQDVGEILPISVGVITFELDFLNDVETFEEYRDRILAYGTLLNELNIDPEEIEWNNMNGWDYVSDDPLVVNEFAVLNDGEVVEADDYLEPFFTETVVQEVLNNPRRYGKVDAYALAESLLGQYRISYDEQNGVGYFKRIREDTSQEVRASADLNKTPLNESIEDPSRLADSPWAPLEEADAPDGSDY